MEQDPKLDPETCTKRWKVQQSITGHYTHTNTHSYAYLGAIQSNQSTYQHVEGNQTP